MRDFLDSILASIGSTSLTDVEFEALDVTELTNGVYDQASYDCLAQLLVDRAAISTYKDRLTYLYKSKGVDVDATTVSTAKSEIFIGAVLE